jgi:hypothetical protein
MRARVVRDVCACVSARTFARGARRARRARLSVFYQDGKLQVWRKLQVQSPPRKGGTLASFACVFLSLQRCMCCALVARVHIVCALRPCYRCASRNSCARTHLGVSVPHSRDGRTAGLLLPQTMAAYEHPVREGVPDCTFYIKTGQCKFGSSCKYNHPPQVVSPRCPLLSTNASYLCHDAAVALGLAVCRKCTFKCMFRFAPLHPPLPLPICVLW